MTFWNVSPPIAALVALCLTTVVFASEGDKSYQLQDGSVVSGLVIDEGESGYLVRTNEGTTVRVPYADIVAVTTLELGSDPVGASPQAAPAGPDLSPIAISNPVYGRYTRSGKIKLADDGRFDPSHGVPITLCERFYDLFQGDSDSGSCSFDGHKAQLGQLWAVGSIDGQTRFLSSRVEHQGEGKIQGSIGGWSENSYWYSTSQGIAYELSGDGSHVHLRAVPLTSVPTGP